VTVDNVGCRCVGRLPQALPSFRAKASAAPRSMPPSTQFFVLLPPEADGKRLATDGWQRDVLSTSWFMHRRGASAQKECNGLRHAHWALILPQATVSWLPPVSLSPAEPHFLVASRAIPLPHHPRLDRQGPFQATKVPRDRRKCRPLASPSRT
jgi:hypothetical protein